MVPFKEMSGLWVQLKQLNKQFNQLKMSGLTNDRQQLNKQCLQQTVIRHSQKTLPSTFLSCGLSCAILEISIITILKLSSDSHQHTVAWSCGHVFHPWLACRASEHLSMFMAK